MFVLICILALLQCAHHTMSCSHVIVESGRKGYIGRTMELGPIFPWSVHVHPRKESMPNPLTPAQLCPSTFSHTKWNAKYGYVSIDTLFVTLEGMNEVGMTISPLIFESGSFGSSSSDVNASDTTTVCSGIFASWVLGNFERVADLKKMLTTPGAVSIRGPRNPEDNADRSVPYLDTLNHLARLHWAIDDAYGDHIVVEVVNGEIKVHDNDVGILTNDPSYEWHLHNLNNYATMSPTWPAVRTSGEGRDEEIGISAYGVDSEIGRVPQIISHGFNLQIPGDASPVSRFVRLFYLRQFALLQRPPQIGLHRDTRKNETITLVTGLLNTVFIVEGTIAKNPNRNESKFESTTFSALKIPKDLEFYYKVRKRIHRDARERKLTAKAATTTRARILQDYANPRWKRIALSELKWDFGKDAPSPVNVVDGTIGVEDVTYMFQTTARGTSRGDHA